jgi:hypothetical protein
LEDIILFCPDQIICIDWHELRLFAEVIQMIPERDSAVYDPKGDRLWARPLALATPEIFAVRLLHDLRTAPQLILPSRLFRAALDTEVMPLMMELFQLDDQAKSAANTELIGRQALHAFVASLWPQVS